MSAQSSFVCDTPPYSRPASLSLSLSLSSACVHFLCVVFFLVFFCMRSTLSCEQSLLVLTQFFLAPRLCTLAGRRACRDLQRRRQIGKEARRRERMRTGPFYLARNKKTNTKQNDRASFPPQIVTKETALNVSAVQKRRRVTAGGHLSPQSGNSRHF